MLFCQYRAARRYEQEQKIVMSNARCVDTEMSTCAKETQFIALYVQWYRSVHIVTLVVTL